MSEALVEAVPLGPHSPWRCGSGACVLRIGLQVLSRKCSWSQSRLTRIMSELAFVSSFTKQKMHDTLNDL